MYTSYFAKVKKLRKNNLIPVGVAVFPLTGFDGVNLEELAPDKRNLQLYNKGSLTFDQYIDRYKDKLSRLNRERIIKQLKMLGGNRVVLCCYEKNQDECHRKVLADWLRVGGVVVKEYIDYDDAKEAEKKRQEQLKEQIQNNQQKLF